MRYNRLLTDSHREYYKPLIERMFETCPEMMSRKIKLANVQQAFILDSVEQEISSNECIPILCVGSFEDTAYECLLRDGKQVVGIDPDINEDLRTFAEHTEHGSFGVIFSTSVIEHVHDDEQFITDICNLLRPGGLAVLTCDFNNSYEPGDPLPYSDVRFYTEDDLKNRLGKVIHMCNCEWTCDMNWVGKPDFIHDNCSYSFATVSFRKASK